MRISTEPNDPGYFPWAQQRSGVQVYFNGGLAAGSHRIIIMADEEQRKVRFCWKYKDSVLVNHEINTPTRGNAVHVNPDAGPDAMAMFEEEGDVIVYLSPELREVFQEHQRSVKIAP